MDIKMAVAGMTLEEKASLLSGQDAWRTKPVPRMGIESVMVSDGPHGLRKQAEGGGADTSIEAVCFPAGCATAASFDRDLMRALGEAIGESALRERVGVVLGPAVNIKRSPLCGRNFEYYSEDPYLAGEAGASFVEGLQSRNVGASVKHFACNNQEKRRMTENSVPGERALREIYLPAFEKIVKRSHPFTVMCSYNRLNGVYASENRALLTDILRGEWGFDGCVVSDWGAVNDRAEGVRAGLDLEMPASCGVNDRRVVEAVRAGKLDERYVDQCCERLLALIARCEGNKGAGGAWDREAQHALARRMAAQCMVLLKNEGGLLPLKKDARVAVVGAFAKAPRFQGGGSSHINCFKTTGAMDILGDWPNVTYSAGYDPLRDEPDEALIREAVEAARGAQAAVIFAGLPDAYECEGYDRAHMRMPACQEVLIERVARANPNTAVVLHNGSPVEMPWIGSVKAVLEAYLGGQAVGGATVDVLFGDANPCGRLPETFPLRLEDTPAFPWFGGDGDTVEYREGVLVGYRWYDKKKADVLFPFGHGLSYTAFKYENLRLSAVKIRDTDTLTVEADVTNIGKMAGKEVVQLYVADREASVVRPVRELKGYVKLSLEPGETKTAVFQLDKRAFAYWEERVHAWRVETGAFGIEIGRSSRDIALQADVWVDATEEIPLNVTANTPCGDILRSPKAMAVLRPLVEAMGKGMGVRETESAAAREAITSEMVRAMLNDWPIRGALSHMGGALTYDQLEKLIATIPKE